MKFLIDAQLPTKLVGWLTARGHEARHVVDLPNGLRLPDAEIWQHAANEAFIIVSKDKDYLECGLLERGLVHLRCGQCGEARSPPRAELPAFMVGQLRLQFG